jgi:hypothetical protein
MFFDKHRYKKEEARTKNTDEVTEEAMETTAKVTAAID